MPAPSSSLCIPVSSYPPDPLEIARSFLASVDLYAREAGAQLLAGQSDPEGLRLIETACKDREGRVVSGGLRALFASVARGSPEAETVLLRLVTQNSRIRTLIKEGGADRFGALPLESYTPRQTQFLLDNPDLARCRLSGLETGTFCQVQAYRSERLRSNPSFAALFDVIRSDPELPRTLKAIVTRRREFIVADGVPRTLEPYWNDIRRMTGLFAGLCLEPALAALTETVVDRSVRREGEALWKRMASETLFVSELVIGSGAHCANFCSTLATLRPDCLPLVVEQRPRLGGQFASPVGSAWSMNCRCRPLSPDRRSRPGTGEGLNSLGAYAPIQEADLTGQSYAPQSAIGRAIRLSLFLSAHALTGVRYLGYAINDALSRKELGLPIEPTSQGRYLVTLQSVATGEKRFLAVDTIIHTGGLGKPNVAFRDPKSLNAIQQEQARQMPGAMPRYLAFGDFMARLADPSIPFPLRGLEKVMVIGKGDSGKVAVESLLGYAPGVRNTVHSLDRVGEVIWMGQSSRTREQFLACERSRYHPLAAEFPAADDSTSFSRITPVPFRAERFSVEKGKAVVESSAGVDYTADIVIDCTGFERRGTQRPVPLARLEQTLRTGTRLRLCTEAGSEGDVILKCQSVVRKGEGENRRVELTGIVQRFVARYAASGVFSLAVEPCREEELGSILERTVQQTLGLSDTSPLFLRDTVLPVVYSTVNGVRTPIARSEVGKNVFYLGPQSGLPYQASGSSKSGENAVALWRYAGAVTAFAEYYFANLLRPNQPFSPLTPTFVPSDLPKARSRKGDETPLSFPVTAETIHEPPREMRRLLHYALCETLRGFRLPKQGGTTVLPVTLLLRPSERAGERLCLTVQTEMQTEMQTVGGVSLRPLLEALGTEPLVQQAMLAHHETLPAGKRMMGSLPIHLEIRLRGGRLGLGWMSVRPFQLWTQVRDGEPEERVPR